MNEKKNYNDYRKEIEEQLSRYSLEVLLIDNVYERHLMEAVIEDLELRLKMFTPPDFVSLLKEVLKEVHEEKINKNS